MYYQGLPRRKRAMSARVHARQVRFLLRAHPARSRLFGMPGRRKLRGIPADGWGLRAMAGEWRRLHAPAEMLGIGVHQRNARGVLRRHVSRRYIPWSARAEWRLSRAWRFRCFEAKGVEVKIYRNNPPPLGQVWRTVTIDITPGDCQPNEDGAEGENPLP